MLGVVETAKTTVFSLVGFFNRQMVQLLKRIGVLKLGKFGFSEDMESGEEYNTRVDLKSKKKVPFKFHVEACADLAKFLDPSSDDFLTWKFGEGSYVDLPGLADGVPTDSGYIKLVPYKSLIYEFFFTGNDGKKYRYYGSKNLLQLNQLKAWTTLKGEVTEVGTGKKVLDSVAFFGKDSFVATLIPFLLSMRIR